MPVEFFLSSTDPDIKAKKNCAGVWTPLLFSSQNTFWIKIILSKDLFFKKQNENIQVSQTILTVSAKKYHLQGFI